MRAMIALAGMALALVLVSPAWGARARPGNYQPLSLQEDGFYNYDNTSKTVSFRRVDWAVALVFWNNASIEKVKNSAIGPLYDQSGSKMNGRLSERRSRGFVWDEDGGRKTTKCPGAPTQPRTARHYRIYADGDDRLYNLSYGYYVYGSTHFDINECSLSAEAEFGLSERAESRLFLDWNRRVGNTAVKDHQNYFNREPYRIEGDHVWDNNGRATFFRVR